MEVLVDEAILDLGHVEGLGALGLGAMDFAEELACEVGGEGCDHVGLACLGIIDQVLLLFRHYMFLLFNHHN